MNGVARITSAIFLGGLIVVGALLFVPKGTPNNSSTITAVDQKTRPYIAPEDKDGDGVSDWLQQFDQQLVAETATVTSSDEPYTPPTTVTGQYAVRLFEQFLFNDPTVPLTPEERDALVAGTFDQMQAPVISVVYGVNDIRETDSSIESVRAYGNALGETLLPYLSLYENETGELHIIERALAANDPEKLTELDPIRISYQQLVQDLLLVAVPPQFIPQHLAVINATRGIYEDVSVMQKFFVDPLLSLAYLSRYSENTQQMYDAYASIFNNIYGRGVRYANDEPAGLFILQVSARAQ